MFKFLFNAFTAILAAFVGNWLGGQIRSGLSGEKVQTLTFEHESSSGLKYKNAPVATKLYPAVLCALIGKPRWLFAFMGGLAAGGLVPDRFEQVWLENVIEPLFLRPNLGNG
jgi:hypothetical protein